MPDWSRRQTLSALAGALPLALAGCQGSASSESSTTDRRPIEDYEVERVRNGDGAALLSPADAANETEEREEERPARVGTTEYLTQSEDLDALTFADVPEARTLREFSAATDFESQSVYLAVREVPECYELRILRVVVDDSGPSVHFCRDLRPVDAACGVDATDTVGYAVRLPVPGDGHNGLGSGMSSSCARPPRPESFDANVTLANGSDAR